jgi:hypothetical protein
MEETTMSATNGGPAGYERTDANTASIWKFIIGLFVFIGLSGLAMLLLFRFLYRTEQASMPMPTPMEARRVVPPLPHLQISPTLDLETLQSNEQTELSSYGWVDKNAGVVRIPVDRAIELIAERGLPKTPATQTRPAARVPEVKPAGAEPKPAATKPEGGKR